VARVGLQVHGDLDAAVANAYRWLANLSDEKFLRRVVALNAGLAEQARVVRAALVACPTPATAGELAQSFKGARADRVGELLETLASLG
jgi:hypothetical protein